MTLAVDVIDRHGPSNKIGHQGKAVLAIYLYSSKSRFIRPLLLTRRSALVLKVGVLCGWKMAK